MYISCICETESVGSKDKTKGHVDLVREERGERERLTGGGGVLAAGAWGVEGGSERQVEGHQVLVGTNDAEEVQTELSQIQILDRHMELVRCER